MSTRTRLALSSAVLLVGAVTTACGGGGSGAPADASEEEFCDAQSSLLEDLLPGDMTTPEMPSNEDMAQSVKDWGAEIEEVGTPEDIPDAARAGFEAIVEQAKDIDAADFDTEKLEELEMGGGGRLRGGQGAGAGILRLPHRDVRQPHGQPRDAGDAGDARIDRMSPSLRSAPAAVPGE